MRVLIYSRGFPNPVEEHRSAFVAEIIRFLPSDIAVAVVAPVPYWLGSRAKKRTVRVPQQRQAVLGERTVDVYHPRFPLLPRNWLRPVVAWLEAVFTYPTLRKLRHSQGIDLIHVNWGYPDGCAVACLSAWLKIPYVLTEHQGSIGSLLQKGHYNRLLGNAYRRSQKLILVSQSLLEPLKQVRGGIPQPVVIPNGIDTQKFALAKKSPQLVKLVYVGNLIPNKGVAQLIQALEILRGQGHSFTLDIYGGGSQKRELEALAGSLQLSDSVSIKGTVAPERIPQLLADYHALVLPTLVESFGIVLIEALAAGLPVLSTHSGGPEHIVAPELGTLVQPGSAEALAAGIQDLQQRWESFDPQKIREYCRQRFDLRKLCPALAQVYREAVNSTGARS